MSRNRILNHIRRVAAQHAPSGSHQSDQPWLITRRSALQLGSTAVAALAMPRLAWSRSPRTSPRIAIVGAGIAGLTAALTLHDQGIVSTVFDSSHRIGGRMHSNHGFWQQGQTSEWCGEFIDTGHIVLQGLATRFGLTLVDVNAAIPPGSLDTNFFRNGYYTDNELYHDMKAIVPILNQQAAAVGPTVLYNNYTPAAYFFDQMSVYDWIETYVPGAHGSRLGSYIDRGIVALCGIDTPQVSSLAVILPVNSDERFHTLNGNQQIPQAIARALPQGSIRQGHRLTAIVTNSDATVTLTFQTSAGAMQETFDAIVLALPFTTLRQVDFSQAGFDALKTTAIQQLGYGTNSKLSLQFDSRYWNGTGPWPGQGDGFVGTDLPIQGGWDSSRAEPGSFGLHTNYTGGAVGAAFHPDQPFSTSLSSTKTVRYAEELLTQLEVIFPGISPHYQGLATLSFPTGDPNIKGSYSGRTLGQYTAFFGYEQVAQGNIHFAGEHTSVNFPGYMEGGAETGARAAKQILATWA